MSTFEARRSVLLVAESTDPRRGGQERSIAEYASRLALEGWDVAVASTDAGVEGHSHVALGTGTQGRGSRTAEILRYAEDLAREHRETMLVHAMLPVRSADLYMPRGGVYAEAYARSRASRAWWSRGAAALALRANRRRRQLLAAEAALLRDPRGPLLVALSRAVGRHAQRHFAVAASRVRVVHNGVDLARLRATRERRAALRRDLEIPEGAVLLLAMAHNFRLKGIPQLCAAARLLPDDVPWRLLIAGGGRPVPAVPRVRFLGARADGAELIAASDAVVHPSFYDPCSRIVLEALAMGRPVVASRHDGAAELVGDAGIVIDDPTDVVALAAALTTLLDPAERAPRATAADGQTAAVSMTRHVREMTALYQELAAARQR